MLDGTVFGARTHFQKELRRTIYIYIYILKGRYHCLQLPYLEEVLCFFFYFFNFKFLGFGDSFGLLPVIVSYGP